LASTTTASTTTSTSTSTSIITSAAQVVKALRKGETGVCIIAGNISPIDVISHIPVPPPPLPSPPPPPPPAALLLFSL
jgi:ribosomal protein L7Ae-like RNA K-turn-binding protein